MSKIVVKISTDYTTYNAKWVMGLTKRQLACFGIAALIGLPVFFLLKFYFKLGDDIASWALIIISAPCFAFLKRINDQPLEVFARIWLRRRLTPMVRPYKTENIYEYLVNEELKYEQLQAKASAKSKKGKTRGSKKSAKHKESPEDSAADLTFSHDFS